MGIFDKIKTSIKKTVDLKFAEYEKVIEDSYKEVMGEQTYFFEVKVGALKVYNEIVGNYSDEEKINFILHNIKRVLDTLLLGGVHYHDKTNAFNRIRFYYINYLFRTKLSFTDLDFERILNAIYKYDKKSQHTYKDWGLHLLINQVEKKLGGQSAGPTLKPSLEFIKQKLTEEGNTYLDKDRTKFGEKIASLLFEKKDDDDLKPVYFMGKDEFSTFANDIITDKSNDEKKYWFQLITKSHKATGGKPSKKYLDECKEIINELGAEKFKATIHEWFGFLISLKEIVSVHEQNYNGQIFRYTTSEFLSALNIEAIKGFVWMCSLFHDNKTIQIISKLAERSFKKIPQKGPAAQAIGNACIYSLYSSKGLDGIGQLSRLRLKIKQNNTLTLIDKYLTEAAEKLNITKDEIEDIAVDDYKLIDGKRTFDFDGYKAIIEITAVGKSDLKWFKENGSEQKSVPAIIKEKEAARLKKVKDTQKQIDQATSTQRDRFDRLMRGNRTMTLGYFKEKYLNHGLLQYIVKDLIFNFINEKEIIQGISQNGRWRTLNDSEINLERFLNVSLWHPVISSTDEVKGWREYLIDNKIRQPFKQAFREIYLLTEAELRTRTYSNRMAAHVLKQHQYVTLAKGRNWSARLQGAWDGGDNDIASLNLPEYNLRAEYWVNSLNAEDEFNESGIWKYVTTDQVRFVNTQTQELINLVDVPAVAFSEVLRDVDLFVGVSSVGNDPTWQDTGGLPAYRDYWQSYSFGDLSELAKSRKETLTSLIPRLKIAKITSIEDKFVVVKGKIRTYKIHIGSGNILMAPNDQYLCIVPDRSKKDHTENIFLPFEGDGVLSVILSKAFLLAEDDKITDSTITTQINR